MRQNLSTAKRLYPVEKTSQLLIQNWLAEHEISPASIAMLTEVVAFTTVAGHAACTPASSEPSARTSRRLQRRERAELREAVLARR